MGGRPYKDRKVWGSASQNIPPGPLNTKKALSITSSLILTWVYIIRKVMLLDLPALVFLKNITVGHRQSLGCWVSRY